LQQNIDIETNSGARFSDRFDSSGVDVVLSSANAIVDEG
jgi:hypothetical protein